MLSLFFTFPPFSSSCHHFIYLINHASTTFWPLAMAISTKHPTRQASGKRILSRTWHCLIWWAILNRSRLSDTLKTSTVYQNCGQWGGSCATFRSAKAPGICAPTSWHLTWSSYQIKPPPGPSKSLDTMLFSHLNHYVDFLNKANYHPSPIPMEFRSILKNCSSGWQRHNSALLT